MALWLDVILRPRRAFAQVAAQRAQRPALVLAAVTSAAWIALLAVLAARGHAPSGPLVLPIARADYYRWQAIFYLPVFGTMLLVAAAAGWRTARALGGTGSFSQSFELTCLSLATPSLLGWWLPDAVVLLVAGFEGLGPAVRVIAPVSGLWALVLLTLAARAVHGLSTGRALLTALAAYAAQAAVSAPFLR